MVVCNHLGAGWRKEMVVESLSEMCGKINMSQILTCSSSPGCIYTAGPAALSVQYSKLERGGQGEVRY